LPSESWRELKMAARVHKIGKYEIGQTLGEGTFGK
jgi:HD-GYP domain-containing protein (c-di-GMP phosphodiesterase class II)